MANYSLGTKGWAAFLYKQFTSMRFALILLLLLGVGAIPGSLFPQKNKNESEYLEYLKEHEKLGKILDALGFFNVFSSAWFSAIYILLFLSLILCIIPRIFKHFKNIKKELPTTPKNLARLDGYCIFALKDYKQLNKEDAKKRALRFFKKYRYKFRVFNSGDMSISSEKGFIKEWGNILFHISLVGILLCVLIGSFLKYEGQRIIVEGQTFPSVLSAYDSFSGNEGLLHNFELTLNSFTTQYADSLDDLYSGAYGQATDYSASVVLDGQETELKVNKPLNAGGANIYLLGNGYAPHIIFKNTEGEIVFSDNVICLPEDAAYTSSCVIKITDGLSDGEQIAFVGYLYPTAVETTLDTGEVFYISAYPDLAYPALSLNVYKGDLYKSSAVSAYSVNIDDLEEVLTGAEAIQIVLGESFKIEGLGEITLDYINKFISVEIRYDPTEKYLLIFAVLATLGLMISLFSYQKRIFIRFKEDEIEVAGISKESSYNISKDTQKLIDYLFKA